MRLQAVRESLKLSQTDFARAVGISRTTISGIESGKRGIPKSIIAGLIKLNVNPTFIFEGAGEMFLNAVTEGIPASTGKAVNFAYQEVPFVTIPARAGFAEHFGTEEEF